MTSTAPVRIALAMIVRDEEANLSECLRSVDGLVDEIVVVDTGSTDDTVGIASSHGARIVHFTWCDDFAAARNAAIKATDADWLLVLDADERLAPDDGKQIREAIAKDDFVCGLLHLYDASRSDATADEVLNGQARLGESMFVPRLLKRTADLAYEGVVHETVLPWLLRHDNRTREIPAKIIHYGAIPTEREARNKAHRNTRLLEKRLKDEPENFTIHGYLAHEYLGAKEKDKAWSIIEQGWALMQQTSPATLLSVLRLASARALMQFQRDDAQGALETARAAAKYEGRQPDLSFFSGRAQEILALQANDSVTRRSLLHEAEKAYRYCLSTREKTVAQRYVRGVNTWASATRLGTVQLLLGQTKEAMASFQSAIADNDLLTEAHLGYAETLVELGQGDEALEVLAGLDEDSQNRPDRWQIAAMAADDAGALEPFKQALAQSRERADDGYIGVHRNQHHGSLHCQLLAYLGQPAGGTAAIGTACAIMAGTAPPEPWSMLAGEQRRLRTFVRNLINWGQSNLVDKLLLPNAEPLLPGISKLIHEVVSSLGMSIEDQPD